MPKSDIIQIDPLSANSLFLQSRCLGRNLSTATGFVVESESRFFLITNWHVLSGRHADTDELLSATGAVPDELLIRHHNKTGLGSWIIKSEKLVDQTGMLKWLEHPCGRHVDVVALPLEQLDQVQLYPLDTSQLASGLLIEPGLAVSIIGYPLGLSTGGNWPIWKTGHIASDPDLDFGGKPNFLIDATTRQGMSGSPVVVKRTGAYSSEHGLVLTSGRTVRFLGVYSSHFELAEVGRVWRPSVIDEILSVAAY